MKEENETTLIRIDRETHRKIKNLAFAFGVSIKDCVEKVVTDEILRNKDNPVLRVSYFETEKAEA